MEPPDPISDYERERGKPPSNKAHGYTQANLAIALTSYRDQYTMFSELMLELDGREIIPDLSVYPKTGVDLVHDETRVTDPPLLDVEIATAPQNAQTLIERVAFLLDAGVQSCWLVQPPLRTGTVFSGNMDGTTVSSGSVTDPVLDIEVSLKAIFDPDEYPLPLPKAPAPDPPLLDFPPLHATLFTHHFSRITPHLHDRRNCLPASWRTSPSNSNSSRVGRAVDGDRPVFSQSAST